LNIGNATQQYDHPVSVPSSKIYLLDIRNYTWIDRFEPENMPAPSNTTLKDPSLTTATSSASAKATDVIMARDDNQLNTLKIVIGVISGVVGTAVIMITGFFGYKWYQRRMQNRIIRISGTV